MRGDKKYLALTFLILTFLGIFFYHFIHLEKEAEIQEIKNKISQNKKEIDLIKNFNNKHKNMEEEISILAQRHFRVTEAFPEYLNEDRIIKFLNESSSDHNLKILLLSSDEFKEDTGQKAFKQIFHLKIQGDYFNILDFLYELNNSYIFFDTKHFYLKSDMGILTLDMEINCYFSNNKTR